MGVYFGSLSYGKKKNKTPLKEASEHVCVCVSVPSSVG